MSYQVLARKWRPARFADVVGQAHVVSALSNALDQDRVHHAFLFTGTRGVGKTTLARIFAKALNCEQGVSSTPCGECAACQEVAEGRFVDLIEVDAASRNKVDDTRELLENVQYAPTRGRYKVYLIDEVHMLSTHSFNALLKTLEEPPEHVKFLLATTDPQKLPMTVLSRCIQFSLSVIETYDIEQQMAKILQSESIAHEPAALSLLARAADGSLRDGLSLLDQSIAYSNRELGEASVREMLGLVDGQTVIAILDALAAQDADSLMACSTRLTQMAQDLQTVLDDLLSHLHAIALYQFSPEAVEWKGLVKDELARLATVFQPELIQLFYQIVLNGKRDFAFAPDPRTGFEMVLLRLLAFKPGSPTGGSQEIESARFTGSGAARDTVQSALAENQAASISRDSSVEEPYVPPSSNLAEEAEPFLQDGLQNADLQQHLKLASALASTERETQKNEDEPPKEEAARQTSEARAQSPFLPKEMMDINALIDNINVWSDFIARLGLSGVCRQLVVHLRPMSYDGGVLNLQLDERYGNLQSEERLQTIRDSLRKSFGQNLSLNISLDEVDSAYTAAGVIAKRERTNLEKTRQDFKDDENIREMISLFDAEVDETSIKSVN